MSGIAPKQNAFKFKIAPHKQKFWQKDAHWRTYLRTLVNPALYKENNGRDVSDYNVDINAQIRNIGMQNNLRVFGSNKSKDTNRIAKIC